MNNVSSSDGNFLILIRVGRSSIVLPISTSSASWPALLIFTTYEMNVTSSITGQMMYMIRKIVHIRYVGI